MKFVILEPNNKRLKQLIKEFGHCWKVINASESPHCFNGNPAMFIESLTTNGNGQTHSRWVELKDVTTLKGIASKYTKEIEELAHRVKNLK